jgi:hypothetical protein
MNDCQRTRITQAGFRCGKLPDVMATLKDDRIGR